MGAVALSREILHVANATALLAQNPIAVLYVATVLAHRLDGANHALIQLKHNFRPASRTAWSPNRSVRWKDFSPPVAPALFMPDIHTIRSHDYRRLVMTLAFFTAILDAGGRELLAAARGW
jgi:hypothetical protein